MGDIAIKAERVSKKFCLNLKRSIIYGTHDVFRNMFAIPNESSKLRKSEFWALDDVSFELKRGETLGIIGVNGSGKSTLLRLLSGIFPPDKGRISVHGKIGSLIAVGAGFHPYMTGRENIYLNGTILGMTREEIRKKFDSIVDFAEIGDFLEAPVSTYSSGMRVRLGFAIAVHCDPDILLIDEVLSVGDLGFRNKSLRYMTNLREKAKAIIFISHNLEQVRVLCSRVIILDKGGIIFDGPTHEACVLYEELTRKMRLDAVKKESTGNSKVALARREGTGQEIDFVDLGIFDKQNNKTDAINIEDPLIVYYDFNVKKEIEGLYFSIGILNEDYKPCIWLMSNDNNQIQFNNISKGNYRLIIRISEHHLKPSVYIPNISIRNDKTGETYERIMPSYAFRVISDGIQLERGIVNVDGEWELIKNA